MSTSLEEVLGAVRAGVEARRKEALERAEAIKEAADAYAEAVAREVLSEVAAKVGVTVEAPEGVSARRAAEVLRAAVSALPELSKSVAAPSRAPEPKTKAGDKKARAVEPSAPSDGPESGRSLSARLSVPQSVRAKIQAAGDAGVEARKDEEPSYPRLREAARHGRIVVLGGLAKKDKIERLKGRLGFETEWIETDRAGAHAIQKLEGRILDGRIAAVVVLDGLIGHAHFEPIARATRQTGTLLVYGDKAGRASLEQAFLSAETQLAKKR